MGLQNNRTSVIIIIPVFKEQLTLSEEASLVQLFALLGKYEICLITHLDLNIEAYKKVIGVERYKIEYFDQINFQSLQSYNKLMLSVHFYEKFKNYKHMLLYQLDAWVFKNDLDHWCKKNYDYIGAPWFEDFHAATSHSRILGVGNGGLSLRKPKGHLSFLKKIRRLEILRKYSNLTTRVLLEKSIRIARELFLAEESEFERKYKNQEDYFWTIDAIQFVNQPIVSKSFFVNFLQSAFNRKRFIIAPAHQALMFSFEVNPSVLYKVNKNLPFGCHAWERYDLMFWQRFIQVPNKNKNKP